MSQHNLSWCCAVCGDAVLARNYGALTCKSCKPFFRRNAKHEGKFFCKYGGNCKVTIKTRKKCQKCRLDKCFAVGMRKELLMDEVDKHFRRSLIQAKRKKEEPPMELMRDHDNTVSVIAYTGSSSSCGTESPSDIIDSPILAHQLSKQGNDTRPAMKWYSQPIVSVGNIASSMPLEQLEQGDARSEHIATMEAMISGGDLLHQSLDTYRTTLDFVDRVLSLPKSVSNYRLGINELNRLKELYKVFKPLDIAVPDNGLLIAVNTVNDLVCMVNLKYDRWIRTFNKTITSIDVMDSLCQNDKIILIKHSCFDIQILRSVKDQFDQDHDSWIIPNDDKCFILKVEFLKSLVRKSSITYRHYLHQLSDIISECDSVIIYLLTAICLFNPKRPGIVDKEQIEFQHRVYLNLLHKYLQFKYTSNAKSEEMFAKLLNAIIFSHILSEWEKKYFVEHYSEHYSQTVRDMLDID